MSSEIGNKLAELLGAIKNKVEGIDGKKTAVPILEATGKTVIFSLAFTAALSTLWLQSLAEAAQKSQEQVPALTTDEKSAETRFTKPTPLQILLEATAASVQITALYTFQLAQVWVNNTRTLLDAMSEILRARR